MLMLSNVNAKQSGMDRRSLSEAEAEAEAEGKQGSRYSRDLRRPRHYTGILNILNTSHELE